MEDIDIVHNYSIIKSRLYLYACMINVNCIDYYAHSVCTIKLINIITMILCILSHLNSWLNNADRYRHITEKILEKVINNHTCNISYEEVLYVINHSI